ncbi:MAG: hypothetical protein J7K62_01935 [Thermoplasmata archaeon]|nr:hypothetical protein [Thermoplasmata archaeon]
MRDEERRVFERAQYEIDLDYRFYALYDDVKDNLLIMLGGNFVFFEKDISRKYTIFLKSILRKRQDKDIKKLMKEYPFFRMFNTERKEEVYTALKKMEIKGKEEKAKREVKKHEG